MPLDVWFTAVFAVLVVVSYLLWCFERFRRVQLLLTLTGLVCLIVAAGIHGDLLGGGPPPPQVNAPGAP
jgi:hypothetical protein